MATHILVVSSDSPTVMVPPTRVRVLEVVSTDDVTTTYMVTDEEGNKFEARTAILIPEDVVGVSSIPQTSDE